MRYTWPLLISPKVGDIDDDTEYLIFNDHYDSNIDIGVLPESIKYIIFGRNYNKKLIKGSLPKQLEYIIFGDHYNQIIDVDVLPNTLLYLQFGHDYNLPLYEGVLPESLNELFFGDIFNQNIKPNILPNNLSYIEFGLYYDKPLLSCGEKVIPKNTQQVIFKGDLMFYRNDIYPLNYKAFTCKNIVIINYTLDLTPFIQIMILLDKTLPQPIVEELIPELDFLKYTKDNIYSIRNYYN